MGWVGNVDELPIFTDIASAGGGTEQEMGPLAA